MTNEKEIRSLKDDELLKIKENILNKGENMASEDRIVRLEASVSALIAAFKAAQEEEEEEKKVQMKAEEEEKLQAEEEAKMVPVSKVAEEEAKDEEKDEEKEEKDEKKIEKLEAAIAQLASLMKASKVTPETPEDEPADTVHKVPKISNEPVKSEKLKDGFKFPLETGGMKPGKIQAKAGKAQGQTQAFTGAVGMDRQDAEQAAVDEIFTFAANRGTTPMIADSRIRTIRY